jgi:hypothetical protein
MASSLTEPLLPVCNLGPGEIRKRLRQAYGHTIVLVVLAAILVSLRAPSIARAVLFVPAALAAFGYLQAWTRT